MDDDPCGRRSAGNRGDFIEERIEIEEMSVWGSLCCVGYELVEREFRVNS